MTKNRELGKSKEREREKLLKRYHAVNCDLRIRARKRLENDLKRTISKLESDQMHFMGTY